MKVLVTGGTGLVGSALIPRLVESGYETYVVTRGKERVLPGATPILADIREPGWVDEVVKVVNRVDCLVYMAYSIGETSDLDRRVTYTGLREAIYSLDPKNVIFTGSVGVFGKHPGDGEYSEESKRNADTEYAKSKILAVNFLFEETNCQVSILHPSIIYADGSDRVEFYRRILAQGYFVYRMNGGGTYSIVHAEDVADAILLAMDRECGNRVEEYIVNGEAMAFREWICLIEKKCGYEEKARIPSFFAPVTRGPIRKVLSVFGIRSPMTLPSDKSKAFESKVSFSTSKIRHHLNWHPKRKADTSIMIS